MKLWAFFKGGLWVGASNVLITTWRGDSTNVQAIPVLSWGIGKNTPEKFAKEVLKSMADNPEYKGGDFSGVLITHFSWSGIKNCGTDKNGVLTK